MELSHILGVVCFFSLVLVFWSYGNLHKSTSSVNINAFRFPDIGNLSFRFYKPEDKESCVQIYKSIEDLKQIPSGMVDEFIEYLEAVGVDQRVFIIQSGDEIIATCGLKSFETSIFLLYGLIKPEYQKRGLGGLMLSLRAEELAGNRDMIALNPTDYSEPYYKRYGFVTCYRVGEEVFAEGDEKLLAIDKDKKTKVMFLMVDQEGALFMRNILERSFTKQLINK